MDLFTLKQQLAENTVSDSLIVFVCSTDTFLAKQYISEICKVKQLIANKITSIYETAASTFSLLMANENTLNVLTVDEFDEPSPDYSQFTNTVVICNSIEKSLTKALTDYIVEIPVLTDWQIKTYMSVLCPGLIKEQIEFLYSKTGGDFYRILNELNKISYFPKAEQQQIFKELFADRNSDLFVSYYYMLPDFNKVPDKNISKQLLNTKLNIGTYLLTNNKIALVQDNIIQYLSQYNLEPTVLVSMMLNDLTNTMLLVADQNSTAATIGISDGKASILSRDAHLILQRYMQKIDFLSQLNLKLKTSQLDLPKGRLLDYILCNVLY